MSNESTDKYNTTEPTGQVIEDNNKLQTILSSLSDSDISDSARELFNRESELIQVQLKQLTLRVDKLINEKEYLQRRLCAAGQRNIELQLSASQARQDKAELVANQARLEQERVVLNAQLAEYRETLQELAGYEFLRLRFD
jgi:chromosome segregation ATPase